MAKSVKITNQGLSLLASSSQATGQYYWLGYYALAYVPNLWKSDSVVLPPADTCNNVNGTPEIISTDIDKVSSTMTRLTKYGDVIYNLWQGDLNGTGYAGGVSDGSAGGNLFGLAMYDANIKKHYRYVLDSNGNNTLVTWAIDASKTDGSMLGKHVYKGTDAFTYSELPIPAPLYYLGDITGKTSVDDYFDEYPTFEDVNYNGSLIYPYVTVNLKPGGSSLTVPKVSTDFRGYSDSLGNASVLPYPSAGAYFDSSEIPTGVSTNYDETGWFAANNTWGVGNSDDDYYYCNEFWKLHTISNYNRFHAPVNSIGHILQSDLSNRNMAKVTKFFPISNYKVISTETKFTSNSQTTEVATAIKLGINIDLSPNTLSTGFDSDGNLDENSNIEFFNRYANAGESDVLDQYNQSIYKSTHTSFKFNRIGIYAVPMRTAAYVSDEGFGVDNTTKDKKLQFQINPDEEPVLFAVIDWDNVVILGDSGDGIHQFTGEINLNLQSPDDAESTALIRDASIFYNLYQDDAQTWYQNQLIANASTSNAITEFGLELAHLKKTSTSAKECCPQPDLSDVYSLKNHSHNFMQNLRDANIKANGGLKGINTAPENTQMDFELYNVGHESVVLGYNTFVSANQSIVGNGINNYINRGSHRSIIGAGGDNIITYDSYESAIMAGRFNKISDSLDSLIGTSTSSDIINSRYSIIVSGDNNHIATLANSTINSEYNEIVNGVHNQITNTKYSNIFNGTNVTISGSRFASVINGATATITNSDYSLIGSGYELTINMSSYSAIINGYHSSITQADRAFIGSGYVNIIGAASSDSFIGSGKANQIKSLSPYSSIISGNLNTIINSIASIIGAGDTNYISGNNNGILSGFRNGIINSNNSFVGGGRENYISFESLQTGIFSGIANEIINCDDSLIGSGSMNIIGFSTCAGILTGSSNYINLSDYSVILGGTDNNINNYVSVAIFGDSITAHRSNALIINSLTLYDSTIELYNQIPDIGSVLQVSSIDDRVATLEWAPNNGKYSSSVTTINGNATTEIVLNKNDVYNITYTANTGGNLRLVNNNLTNGDSCIIRIVKPHPNTVTLNYNGSYNFPITSSLYEFIAVMVGGTLSLIGDRAGY